MADEINSVYAIIEKTKNQKLVISQKKLGKLANDSNIFFFDDLFILAIKPILMDGEEEDKYLYCVTIESINKLKKVQIEKKENNVLQIS